MIPGAIVLITPIVVVFLFGPEVLGGLLQVLRFLSCINGYVPIKRRGAWDNAKNRWKRS